MQKNVIEPLRYIFHEKQLTMESRFQCLKNVNSRKKTWENTYVILTSTVSVKYDTKDRSINPEFRQVVKNQAMLKAFYFYQGKCRGNGESEKRDYLAVTFLIRKIYLQTA